MEPSARLSTLVDLLRERGHRMTPQRMAILRILTENNTHPTAEQVHQQVRREFPMTSLATVYKTVALLKEQDALLELSFGGGSSRYDGFRPYPHPHLICIQCRRILDPDLPALGELPRDVEQKYGFQLLNHRIDFFGICPDCQQEAGTP